MRPRLKYHQAACELLGIKPVLSPGRLALLAERERGCATRFPESVTEWLALEGAETFFDQAGSGGRLGPPEQMGDPADTARGFLRFVIGDPGQHTWYARLGARDDPELRGVYVGVGLA